MTPNLEETYYPGAALDLHAWNLPPPPTSSHPEYDNPPVHTQLSERYQTSVTERVTLPSTPPTATITLEKRLDCSTQRVAHVWTACVRDSSPTTFPPQLVAKIYDPVFFADEETQWNDPFVLRDLAISSEVEAYRRLEPLQGTRVPQFYGFFAAALPLQHGRTVYVVLLELVPGRDWRVIVPPDETGNVCAKHKDAIVDAVLHLDFDILARGVSQLDMQPRNVILRPQNHVSLSGSGTRFCDTTECMLAFEVDCDDLRMAMVDFEMVDFEEPDASLSEEAEQRVHIEKIKSRYLARWLENAM